MSKSVRARLLMIITLMASLLTTTTTAGAASLRVDRISGADRFLTAIEISKASFPGGAPVAFVATGRNYADALAIAASGGGIGPVLLTEPNSLPASTAAELQRLDPSNIVILGGRAAVSDDVQLAIARNARGTAVAVDRLSGATRYETAIAIGQTLRPSATIVYLADGNDYAAGLIASAAAGIRGGILLTTDRNTLPTTVNNELARLAPAELVVVGNVSASVVDQASRWAASARQITGRTATALSVAVAEELWESTEDVLLASAADFPDALASAAWAVGTKIPLLLTDPAGLEDVTACEIFRLKATGAVIAGGTSAVSKAVADALEQGISPFARGCAGSALVQIPDPDPRTAALEVTLYEMTTSPDSKRAYIINNEWNSIEVIDLAEGIWLGRIAVGSNPVDLDISADGKRLYVANNGSQTISVIDTTKPFDRAEIAQIDMLGAGTNARRPFAVESSTDGKSFIIPARLEAVDGAACLQVLDASNTITELVPGTNPNIPFGAVQGFHSADHKLIGVIAPDRGTEPVAADQQCKDDPAPAPAPSPTPTASPTASPTPEPTPTSGPSEGQSLALYTYVSGTWSRIGAWGRPVAEIAYGNLEQDGVTADGSGTTTVFDAVDRSAVLGTVTSEANSSFGLAVQPLRTNCPKNRGNPATCTELAYNVTSGAGGLGVVDVLDITAGRNVQGSFRVVDQFPLQTAVGSYGGKNKPSDPGILNQAAVTADASRLVVATEFAVEIFPIG